MDSSIGLTRLKRPANNVQQVLAEEKPIASGTGISCFIILAEPYVYLHGFDRDARAYSTEHSTAMIRGKLVLNVTKAIKIKAITLMFSGKARTEWPEGKNRILICH
jgi:arrestin-related trafficking adapter 3/6